jgi:phosphatidylinositol kinase/protein kinase (PI-3  family)
MKCVIFLKSSNGKAYKTGTNSFTNFNNNSNQSVFCLELFFLVSSNASFACNREMLLQLLPFKNFYNSPLFAFSKQNIAFPFLIVRIC